MQVFTCRWVFKFTDTVTGFWSRKESFYKPTSGSHHCMASFRLGLFSWSTCQPNYIVKRPSWARGHHDPYSFCVHLIAMTCEAGAYSSRLTKRSRHRVLRLYWLTSGGSEQDYKQRYCMSESQLLAVWSMFQEVISAHPTRDKRPPLAPDTIAHCPIIWLRQYS